MIRKYCEFPITITKAYERVNKATGKTEKHIVCKASDNTIDWWREYFTESALDDMVEWASKKKENKDEGLVELRETHWDNFAIGTSFKAWLEKADNLISFLIDFLLKDAYPAAMELYEDVKSGVVDKELSVGGWIDWESDEDAYDIEEIEVTDENGNTFTTVVGAIKAFILEHVAICLPGQAANFNTGFVEAVLRSIGDPKLQKDWSNQYQKRLQTKGNGSSEHTVVLAVPAKHKTPASEDTTWDSTSATKEIRKWASSDGSGDKDTIDWKKYQKGFGWYDSEDTENFGAYKLCHHVIESGTLKSSLPGCSAAIGAINGARGGIDISDSEKKTAYNHIAKHITDAGEEPPELKSTVVLDTILNSELKSLKALMKGIEMEVRSMSNRKKAEKAALRIRGLLAEDEDGEIMDVLRETLGEAIADLDESDEGDPADSEDEEGTEEEEGSEESTPNTEEEDEEESEDEEDSEEEDEDEEEDSDDDSEDEDEEDEEEEESEEESDTDEKLVSIQESLDVLKQSAENLAKTIKGIDDRLDVVEKINGVSKATGEELTPDEDEEDEAGTGTYKSIWYPALNK